MRLNAGVGCWAVKDAGACLNLSVAGMVELHYNTTLTDAELVGPVTIAPDVGAGPAASLNVMNRSDSLNMSVGACQSVLGTYRSPTGSSSRCGRARTEGSIFSTTAGCSSVSERPPWTGKGDRKRGQARMAFG